MRKRGWNRMEEQGSSLWKDAFLRLSRNAAMFSLLALALIASACFLGPLPWLLHPSNVQDLSRIAEIPSGTIGSARTRLRDSSWRVSHGGHRCRARYGRFPGDWRGVRTGFRLCRGRLDALMMRLVDVLALPFIEAGDYFFLSVDEPARRLTQWFPYDGLVCGNGEPHDRVDSPCSSPSALWAG